jgi:PST family polysaccharide transporter
VNTKQKRTLIENFFSLFSLQFFSYVFPFVTLPYLTRVLGPEKFGTIAFAQAFCAYFGLITEFGFNYSASRDISINRDDTKKVSEIFSAVILIKVVLLLFSAGVMLLIVSSFSKFSTDFVLYVYAFGAVVGQVLFPIWFFQGIEKMKFITIINVISQLVFVVLIFVFIRSADDYRLCALFKSAGAVVGGIVSLFLVFYLFNIKLTKPCFADVLHHFRKSLTLFISRIAVGLHTFTSPFFLGLLAGDAAVGYYSIGQKFVDAIIGLLTPVTQVLYPYLSKLSNLDKRKATSILRIMIKYSGIIGLSFSVGGFLFAPILMRFMGGTKFLASIVVFQILVLMIIPVAISSVVSIQGLIAFGHAKVYTIIVIVAAICHLAILPVFIKFYSYNGAAFSVLLVQSAKVFVEYYYCKKYILQDKN